MNLHDQITDLGGVYHTGKVYFGKRYRHQVVMRLPILQKPGVYVEVVHYSESDASLDTVLSDAFSRAAEIVDAYLLATAPSSLLET